MDKKILQVVGYQNSGKTTLMEKLIRCLTEERGLRVGTMKHHGHGGIPDGVKKDSRKHREAGAVVTVVEGAGVLQLEAGSDEWSLEQIEGILALFKYDVLLIEGYKKATYPKVVLIRHEEDLTLLDELSNIVLVLSWISLEGKCSLQWYDIREEQYIQKISEVLMR